MKKLYILILSFIISISISSYATEKIKNDFFTLIDVSGIPATLCANESFTLDFVTGGFSALSGNQYDAQLSDNTGNFSAQIIIGSISSTESSGIIDVLIPAGTPLGLGYKIRVISTTNDTAVPVIGNPSAVTININCITRDYYWIGGAGNWSDFANHWEYTINDIDFFPATEVPQRTDNVNFDDQSFPTGGTLTVDMQVECNDMYWSADVTTGPQLLASPGLEINIYGDLVMANGVYRDVERFMFRSPTNHAIIDLADNTTKLNSNVYWGDGFLDFWGSSSFELASDVRAEGVRLYDNSIFTTNDFSLDLAYSIYLSSGTFNAGNSTINLQRLEEFGTFNAESSTLIFDKGAGIISGDAVINNAIFESGDFEIQGTNTFNNLRLKEDVKVKLQAGATQTIISNFEALGSRAKMIDIQSSVLGDEATLDLGTSTSLVNFVILQDNIVNASLTPVNAFSSIDNGQNTNWNIAAIASLTYYWIGGNGNWSDVSHWATTDGGATLRTDPPGPVDNVNFTTNSFPNGGKITLDIPADCNNMIWTDGATNPTISSIEGNPLTIRGNLQLAAGVTRNLEDLRFESISSNVITFSETTINTVGNITFDGSGSWSLQDPFSSSRVTLNGGTLNTNNNNIDIGRDVTLNGGALFLGSSQLTLPFLTGSSPSSLNANTSTIVFDGTGNYQKGISFQNFTFYNVIFKNNLTIYGNSTFENLTIEEGAEIEFGNGYTQTFNQSLIINGTRNNMVNIKSTWIGNQGFITTSNNAATIDVNYAQIKDIDIDNADPSFVITNNSSDNGGNTGWDFATNPLVPLTYYWVGGAGNWSDAANHWSSTNGGVANQVGPPGIFDDIIFTANSFSISNETVTLDIPANVHNMTWQDGSLTPIIDDGNDTNILTLAGSLFMVNGVQRSIRNLEFNSAATNNLIQMASNQGDLGSITFNGGGTWTMLDSLATQSLSINSGKLVTNSHSLYVSNFLVSNDQIDLGNSNVNVQIYIGNAPSLLGGETIYLGNNGRLQSFGGFFNNVVLEGGATIRETNNINRLSATVPGSKIIFEEGKTTTINSNLELIGSQDNLIEIVAGYRNPTTFAFEEHSGVQAIISMPGSATVLADYVSIADNSGIGGATFATTNSAIFSNVTGWTGLTGQTISFTTTDLPFADGATTLNGVSDSGLALTYTLIQGDATLVGDVLTPNNPGLVGIRASEAGTFGFAPTSTTRYIHFDATNLSNELGMMKEATYVVGQKDFVSNETFFDANKTPHARKAFVTSDGKLISSGRRRVLIWNQVPGATNIPADVVVGQPNFVSDGFSVNSSTIYSAAYSVAVSNDGRLLVADSRGIMIWNTIPTQNGTPADVIIGQEDFNTIVQEATPDHFQSAVFFILTPDQKLIVSDLFGNRVLIFNQIPTSNGASADIVIGQTNLTSIESGLSSTQLNLPGYPALSPDGKLFIPDAGNNRILVYDSVPTVSGAAADYVLGQVDMNSNVEGIGALGLDYPYSVDISRTGKMAIADRQNDRVLIYNRVPTDNTIAPDYVLGQPDFDTEGINTGGVSGRSINDAYAVYWDISNNLYVGDLQNNRFLVWGEPDFTAPVAFTTGEVITVGGTVVPGYWNSGNLSVDITIPIDNEETLNAGSIQMQVKIGASSFENIGTPSIILASSLDNTQVVKITQTDLLIANGYAENETMIFRAIMLDAGGNSTTGTQSATTLIIDTVAPIAFATGTVSPNSNEANPKYWNATTTVLDIITPIDTEASLDGGMLQASIDLDGSGFVNVGAATIIATSDLGGNLPITINQTDFEGLGIAEGVTATIRTSISDIAGNVTTGTASTDQIIVDRVAPAINTNKLETTYISGANTTSTIEVIEDLSGIARILVHYHLVSQPPNDAENWDSTDDLTTEPDGTYLFDLGIIDTNNEKLGIEYYITGNDNAGNEFTTIANIVTANIRYADGITITKYGVGNTTEDYRLFSISADMDNPSINTTFSNLVGSTYDASKMRIFSYAGGNAITYNEANSGGFSNFEIGAGYFGLAASGSSTTSGAAETSFPVSKTLVNGWNLIGNPYGFDIAWNDVLSNAGLTNELAAPITYDGTANWPEQTMLKVGEGYFVNNTSGASVTINFPVFNTTGGRIASAIAENHNTLDEDSWEVKFLINDKNGNKISIGGVGMELDAELSIDYHDRVNPPAFSNQESIVFNHPEYFQTSFRNDIKPLANQEKWNFEYKIENTNKDKQILHWDNSYFGKNSPDLYLIDKTHFVTINMKEVDSYSFNHANTTNFEVYFGYDVLNQILPSELITQSPFPNPFTNEVSFNIGLPQDDALYAVEIRIFDSVGKLVKKIGNEDISSGYNSILWDGFNKDGAAVPVGLYAYSIHIKGSTLDIVKNGKVIKR